MKSTGKQDRSRQTIQTILDAALQILVDEGFEKANTNRIASRAGYSVGTLYQYFEDKDDIYGKIVEQTLLKITESASQLTIQSSLTETLRTLLELIMTPFKQDPAIIQALESLLNGKFRDKRQAAYDKLVSSIEQVLEAHRDEIVVTDLKLAAGIIVAATAGLATSDNAYVLDSPDMMQHVLRLQFAYLTCDA